MKSRKTAREHRQLRERALAEPLERRVLLAANYTPVVLYQFSGPGGSEYSVFRSAADGQYVGFTQPSAPRQALLWEGSGMPIILNSTGWSSAIAYATDGAYQVGVAVIPGGQENRTGNYAVMWHGAGSPAVNLNPPGFTSSGASGVGGGEEVGGGQSPSYGGALLWHGTAQSAVELGYPAGFVGSSAEATDGVHEVGSGTVSTTAFSSHALLWSGTAGSAIDLNPSGYIYSGAEGVSGNEQVGEASTSIDGTEQAILWTGTAASAINLNPAGYAQSNALATNGLQQVGWAIDQGGAIHAVVWSGTAGSAVILPNPSPQSADVEAFGFDSAGDIYGWAVTPNGGTSYTYQAIEWKPPSQISASGNALSATEGVPVSGVLATFSDSVANDLGNLTATINWGDGTSATGKISFNGTTGQYQVTGSHTYVLGGTYNATVAISDTGGNKDSAIATVNVADAPLSAFSVSLNGIATIPFSGTVGSFSDSDPNAKLSYYTANINWGDGQSSSGTITFDSGTKRYNVSGGHTYASAGTYAVAVNVHDIGGGGTTIASSANILPAGPAPQISGAGTTNEGSSYALGLSAPDALGYGIKSWQIDWGDGTVQQISGSPSSVSHVFADGPATELISASATDSHGFSNSTSSVVMVNDVAPAAVLSATAPAAPGQPGTVTFSSAFDPSVADTVAGFRYSFAFGNDGSFEVVNSLIPTAPIPANYLLSPGQHVIVGRIEDKDGLFTDYTTTIQTGGVGSASQPLGAASQIAAGMFASSLPIQSRSSGAVLLGAGDWVEYRVDFGSGGVKQAKMQLASVTARKGIAVQLRLDDPTGEVLVSFSSRAASAHGQSVRSRNAAGVHDVYLEVVGGEAQVNWFSFVPIVAKHKHSRAVK